MATRCSPCVAARLKNSCVSSALAPPPAYCSSETCSPPSSTWPQSETVPHFARERMGEAEASLYFIYLPRLLYSLRVQSPYSYTASTTLDGRANIVKARGPRRSSKLPKPRHRNGNRNAKRAPQPLLKRAMLMLTKSNQRTQGGACDVQCRGQC